MKTGFGRNRIGSCLGFCLGLLHSPVHAADPEVVGSWPGYLSREHLAAVISGKYAYVASYYAGFEILDISNLWDPVRLGAFHPDPPVTFDTAQRDIAWAVNLAVSGDHAYAAFASRNDTGKGLYALDIADPTKPVLESILFGDSECGDVAVVGQYVYASSEGALRIFDVSNPKEPLEIASVPTTGRWPSAVTVAGDYAYAAAYDDLPSNRGLDIIEVRNPANARRVGWIRAQGFVSDVAVAGRYAYVADGTAGLQIYDVGDPASPQRLGRYDTSGDAKGVALYGKYVCVADGPAGLVIVDVSDPTAPKRVGAIRTRPYFGPSGDPGNAWSVFLSGSLAFVGQDNAGLDVFDLSRPDAPVRVGAYPMRFTRYVAANSRLLFVAEGYHGMRILDLANPAVPVQVGYTTIPVSDMVAAEGYVYYRFYPGGFRILDVNDPAAIKELGTLPGTTGLSDLPVIQGHHAFVTTPRVGLQVFDIADRSKPVLAGKYAATRTLHPIAVVGDHLYMSQEGGASPALLVLDVSDPTTPALVSSYEISPFGVAIKGVGPYLYAGYKDSENDDPGVELIDVSNPRQLRRVSRHSYSEFTGLLALTGSALCLSSHSGLRVLDVSDPTAPSVTGEIQYPLGDGRFAATGNHAYLSANFFGVTIVRLFDVAPTPSLDSVQIGDEIVLTWPSSAVGFLLESTPVLGQGAPWAPAIGEITSGADRFRWVRKAPTEPAFYRLRKP